MNGNIEGLVIVCLSSFALFLLGVSVYSIYLYCVSIRRRNNYNLLNE